MVQIVIPCPHEKGVSNEVVISDYHPLNKMEIEELLSLAQVAYRFEDWRLVSQIQCRLEQGVKGQLCLHRIEGITVLNTAQVDKLFVDNYGSGPTPELVEKLDQLLNWDT